MNSSVARTRVRAIATLAFDAVPAVWPIEGFIATNPLAGLEKHRFRDALALARERTGARGTLSASTYRRWYAQGRIADEALDAAIAANVPAEDASLVRRLLLSQSADETSERAQEPAGNQVDALTIRWLSAFFDMGEAAWPMPYRERGLFAAWKRLARPSDCPERPEEAIVAALQRLQIPETEWEAYLRAHVLALPGWAGLVKWQATHRDSRLPAVDGVEYLAVRLWYDAAFGGIVRKRPRGSDDAATHELIWLHAHELTIRESLVRAIDARDRAVPDRYDADVAFCIDVRSEGFRRNLESVGPYRTRGFAGFFGLPVAVRAPLAQWEQPACPVLLTPKHTMAEMPVDARAGERYRERTTFASWMSDALSAAKSHPAAAFALFEAAGAFFAPVLVAKTLFVRTLAGVRASLAQWFAPVPQTHFAVDKQPWNNDGNGFTPAELAFFAESALSLMAMRDGFARLVLFLGHGSTTENNPFESSLDCGACAGYRGGSNARILAAILNRADVRVRLAERGILIPDATIFLAGEHDTVDDRVTIYDDVTLPDDVQPALARLRADLARAGEARARERALALQATSIAGRSADWAQVRPEWGLARNAAFVIAPRAFTRGVDLGGRAFLHEYDAAADADGALLEIVMTAPLVVAQWINHHYYFATVDNERYGSGTKVIHNVVGRVGVMSGNASDVRAGLPLQSLADDRGWYHEPVRLAAIVAAPRSRIDAVIARNGILQRLFHNEWLALIAYDPDDAMWYSYTPAGSWQPRIPQEIPAC